MPAPTDTISLRQELYDLRLQAADVEHFVVGEQVIDRPELSVPHPRVHQRVFALSPAADIIPDLVHPLLHRSVLDLLNDALQQR